MTQDLQDIKEKSLELLKDFKGVLEIDDFKKFLLVNFTGHASGGPAGMLAMLGMGETSSLSLSYDPMRSIYFNKILGANQEMSQMFLYTKREPIMDEFFTEDPVSILKEYLTQKEIELLGIGTKKKRMVHVTASEFQMLAGIKAGSGKPIELSVDLVYSNLESFIAGYEPHSRTFLLEGEDGDLLFDVNFTPLARKDDVNLVTFDVYFDETKEIAKHAYITMDNKSKIKFTDEVKDTNVQNMLYCLVVPVKSFNLP
jgi:hypothetical protein